MLLERRPSTVPACVASRATTHPCRKAYQKQKSQTTRLPCSQSELVIRLLLWSTLPSEKHDVNGCSWHADYRVGPRERTTSSSWSFVLPKWTPTLENRRQSVDAWFARSEDFDCFWCEEMASQRNAKRNASRTQAFAFFPFRVPTLLFHLVKVMMMERMRMRMMMIAMMMTMDAQENDDVDDDTVVHVATAIEIDPLVLRMLSMLSHR